ncbi:unnamed protein product [Moneuplotes crassus]|uniref:Protein kinase domain-containing protein n=1 Tax=Euplotes crassus TaxID=5936 RepID=A0AAD2D439_EUPCR|nr:unnamed protein product [Moneuplotes crassus]
MESSPKPKTKSRRIGNYLLGEAIIKGGFGEVYLCKVIDRNLLPSSKRKILKEEKQCVCKIIKLSHFEGTKRNKMEQYAIDEANCMKMSNHRNVLKLIDICTNKDKDKIYQITELCNGNDLSNFWKLKKKSFSLNTYQLIIKQVAEGLNYLDKKSICHRDLKPQNIFLDFPEYEGGGKVDNEYISKFTSENSLNESNFRVIVGDFGFAKMIEDGDVTKSKLGTPTYMGPELYKTIISYDRSVDIWSLGIMLYQLWYGFPPFSSVDINRVKSDSGSYRISSQMKCIPLLLDIIDRCLKKDAKDRITYQEILKHPFLTHQSEPELLNKIVPRDRYNITDGLICGYGSPQNCLELNKYNSLELSTHNRENFNFYFKEALKIFDIWHSQTQHEELSEEESKEEVKNPEVDDKQELSILKKVKEQFVKTDRILGLEKSITLSKDSEDQSQKDIALKEVSSMTPKSEIMATGAKKKKQKGKKRQTTNKRQHPELNAEDDGDNIKTETDPFEERKNPILAECDPRSEIKTLPSLTASGESHPNELQVNESLQELMNYPSEKNENSNAS